MAKETRRKLAAILSADVVGYSRLIGVDEVGTLDALRSHRTDLIEPKIAEHDGRVVKLMGDGLLAEFPSAVEAVRCAAGIQQDMISRNTDVPQGRQIIFRIGINIGDIVVEGDDIYGDGVNIAARLEAAAEPGGILVSRNVHDQVKDKLDLTFDYLGDRNMKNIAEPVSVYGVILDDEAAQVELMAGRSARQRRWRLPAVAAVIALLFVAGGLTWWQPWIERVEPADVDRMALQLPDRPSIAVLPFDNFSADPEQEYFADGITDDLITDLSKLTGLFVISRNSTFTYKGNPVEVRQVAEDLGVRYVLEGSVRRVGDEVRINAQLIDALSGYHLWAERYDGSMADIFLLQDKVIAQIVAALAVNLTASETTHAGMTETDVPTAYDAFLQGREHYLRETPEDFAKAIGYLETAIELDPDYSRAHATLAAIYWFAHDSKWDVHLGIEYQALELAEHHLAMAFERAVSEAYRVSAEVLLSWGTNDEALIEINRAIALEPSSPENHLSKAWILTMSGRAVEAEESVRLAMRLNPEYSARYLRQLGWSLFFQRRHQESAELLERAASRSPGYEFVYRLLAAAYGHLGRVEDASRAVENYNALTAGTIGDQLTIKSTEFVYGENWYDMDRAYLAHWLEGLRAAGVPEGGSLELSDIDFDDLVTWVDDAYEVQGAERIDAATAKELHDRGAVFVDARGYGPYSRGHIPGAIHLYFNWGLSFENLASVAGADEDVVFYCGGLDCSLAPKSSAAALVWGYRKVYVFGGGFPEWRNAGYIVETPPAE